MLNVAECKEEMFPYEFPVVFFSCVFVSLNVYVYGHMCVWCNVEA
jgi:hypothetical protein